MSLGVSCFLSRVGRVGGYLGVQLEVLDTAVVLN